MGRQPNGLADLELAQKSCDRVVKENVAHLRCPASRRGGVRAPFKHTNEVRLTKNQGRAVIELTVFYLATAAGTFILSGV